MNESKASRRRIAANWLIFGSLVIGLLACVVRLVLVLNRVTNFDRYILPNGYQTPLPLDMLILIGIVAVCILIGLICLFRSIHFARLAAEEQELLEREPEEAESAYEEEDLVPTEKPVESDDEAVAAVEEPVIRQGTDDTEKVRVACRKKTKCGRRVKWIGKAAAVAVPVVLAVVATTVIVKAAETRRREKARRRFYDWLG